jgi:serine/threonine-protein kinase
MNDPTERLTAALADRYRIERELGAGGMATVYLAEDLKHHRHVAVKVLKPELAATMGPDRFAREVEVAARLQHPHVLGLLDSGEAAGFFYYVMPFVEGETLRDRLTRSGELPVADALRLLTEVAEALAHAHQHGVVHRDIKPENVLLSGRHAMVMDFGVAKAVTEATGRQQLTTAGVALGTPAYMAPEQATADPHLDHRVDIYALGVLAYEMLTGQPPFHGLSPQQTLAAHVTQAPTPVTERRPGLAPALESVIMRCLAKRPADRFQNADEVVAALEPLTAPSGGMTPTQTRPIAAIRVPRSRLPLLAGAVALLAVVSFAAWRAFRGDAAPEATLGQTAPVTSDVGVEIDPALSPDGSLVAYAAGPMMSTRIYVRQVDGGRPIAIGDTSEAGQRWPRWSPDGRRIAFVQGRAVMVALALGGQAREVARGFDANGGADWSPDGKHLVFGSGDSLYVVAADGGAPQGLAAFDDPNSPVWSPDGRFIAVVSSNSAYVGATNFGNTALSTIHLAPAQGGETRVVTDGRSLAVSPAWLPDGRGVVFVSDRDGARDLFLQPLTRDGTPRGAAVRITTGLKPHSVSVAASGARVAYSLYSTTANVWSAPVPRAGSASAAGATPVTRGTQYVESIDLSPDGKWVYFDSDRSGRFELYRVPADGGEQEQLTNAPGLNFYPDASPDGREVVFQSQRNGNRDVFVMPVAGGQATGAVVGPGSDNQPLWFPDGRRLIYTHCCGGIPAAGSYVVERTGSGWSTPRLLVPGAGSVIPGRQFLLVQYLDSLVVMTEENGQRRLLWTRPELWAPAIALRPRIAPDGSKIWFMNYPGRRHPLMAIWELPAAGGTPREVLRFDDPYLQPLRAAWDTDGTRFVFVLHDRQSDVWVADLRLK